MIALREIDTSVIAVHYPLNYSAMNLKFTAILITTFLASLTISFAQDISGIINTYHSISSIDYCRNAIIVTDATNLEVGSDVLLLQMQGASIETGNTSAFGSIIDLGSTGLYEKGLIQSINQDSIFLENSLLNTYDLNGQVQLISYPTYENATVIDTLKAQAWDGTTGGVLAFQVTNTLTLNAPIDATGQGFRGGNNPAPQGNCTGGINNAGRYAYALGDWRGAPKGEGISVSVGGREGGRGAIANGGGGGNDHNSGGGGGANITAGGNGGERLTPFFSFDCRGNNPGVGGNGIPTQSDRIFLGGGGGSGHTNNATADSSNGGNGGGIIIIEVNEIVGNSQAIAANGISAQDVNGDGASGGGAGGTIVLLATTVSGLNVEAAGGNGGNAGNNNGDDCFGPGGGGAGGRLLSNVNNVNLNLSGGLSGRTINSTNSCDGGRNEAEDGSAGGVESVTAVPQGTETVVAPAIVNQPSMLDACLNQDIEVLVETQGVGLDFQWQIDRGNGLGFEDLVDGINYSGSTTNQLTIIDASPNMSDDQFRLILSTECLGNVTSDAISLNFRGSAPIPTFDFDIQTDGTVIFTNTSELGESYAWDFGDGVMSNMENTSHTYPSEGEYEVTLTISNECGTETITEIINIVFAPQAGFNVANTAGCAPVTVNFENQSTENVAAYEWIFEGGEPATSNEASPSIVYNDNGVFDVTLIVTNAVGVDTLYREDYINITADPNVNYIFETEGLEVTFTNSSIGNNDYVWDFGDGIGSSDENNPTYIFPELGVYDVTLTAINECGENSITKQVAVGAAPLAVFSANSNTGCAPVSVQFTDKSEGQVDSWRWEFPGGEPETSTEENPVVRYTESGIYDVTLFVTNELGQDSIRQTEFIEINVAPIPEFEFEIVEDTVFFFNLSQGADLYGWGLGDGTVSIEENPSHVYQTGGIYYVTLNAYNDFCGAAITVPINIVIASTTQVNSNTTVSFYPNPANEFLNIDLETTQTQNTLMRLYNLSGQLLTSSIIAEKNNQVDLENYPSGTYFVQLIGEDWELTKKVVKE